eukprot:GHVR01075605.1.p1 GENE.GHVR01075605.1~~GHVR01075605.1.p1  ORF type:complete len:117 (-),score=8.41 GHVR01075605.1:300-650(-)
MNNRIQFKNHMVTPMTPNIEEYKQKNKSKSKRKNQPLQPTNPPTPKIMKANNNMNSKNYSNYDKRRSNTAHNVNRSFCSVHPDKIAKYCLENNSNQRFCIKCAIALGSSTDEFIPE